VVSTPGSAREARATFEQGYGDALVTYELEGMLLKQANSAIEMVVPEATIFSEHPVVIIDRNVSPGDRPLVEAFVRFLWTDEAQRAFVQNHFRSVTNDALTQENKELATIKYPFTVDYFGGWARAYPEVIEAVFKNQVQKRK
jgi:sulfate/thiosulfate transport system substrate-binding protein